MKYILLVFIILAVPLITIAQTIKGRVSNEAGKPLQGATIIWMGDKKGTVTNTDGEFAIGIPEKMPQELLISFVGYKTDTIFVKDSSFIFSILAEQSVLNDVTVVGRRPASFIASFPVKTEVISTFELKKAACCDLAGCFETQASVLPQTTNIITNSKELRILGLSGIYNQVLIDGFPQIQGMTYTYGISSIPGPMVENIWVAKGANSVLQGYESISGQINVLTKEPGKTDKLLLNAYMNGFGEKHFNGIYGFKTGKWNSLLAIHTVQPARRIDRDDDNFLDLPLLTRYSISNRWKKGDEEKWGWSTQIGVRYLSERRIGGQVGFDYKLDKGGSATYGQLVNIQQPESWFKTAYRLNDKHRFAFYASGLHQQQQSYFGITSYEASQTTGYANLQYEISYQSTSVLKTGFSFRHLSLDENINFSNNSLNRNYAGRYKKTENIPGLFAENTLDLLEGKLTWIAGIRVDHHNGFGWELTPRTLLKYNLSPGLTLRSSVGTGWRTANIFSENIGLLASSRDIIFSEILKPEKAVNIGFNATQKYHTDKVEGTISVDFYRTSFQNQIFPDYDSDPTKAIIQNFEGESVSNGFQVELNNVLYNRVAVKLGYVFLDVYQDLGDGKKILPFNPKHRFTSSASFMPLTKKWHIDANIHWYGKQRLPDTKSNPIVYQLPDESDPYTIVNTQFSYNINKFEFYAGIENIFDFRQNKPIISWQDPFGQYFDTQFAWGPTRGRETYMGLRFILK